MEQEKSTKDIYLAAAWMSLGAKFERVDRTDPRHQIFYFTIERPDDDFGRVITAGKDLNEMEKQWVNESLSGNLYEFSKAIQKMKSIIHSD